MANDVNNYLAKLHDPEREVLEHIRKIIRAAVPDATEGISYGMPGFKYRGAYLAGYAAFKDHLSFFPTAAPIEQLRSKLSPYITSKGTLQFSAASPLPDTLIRELISVRLQTITKGKLYTIKH